MFITFGDKLKEIEDLYNRKEYNLVILESAKVAEEFISQFFRTFHRQLAGPADLKQYIEFEREEQDKYSGFLKNPTIGIAIGYYLQLGHIFPVLPAFVQDIREPLNLINNIRNSHLHSKGKTATDQEAGSMLDSVEKIITLNGYSGKPYELYDITLKYYLISKVILKKFDVADVPDDYRKIIQDSRKIIPVLLKSLIFKYYTDLAVEDKLLLLNFVDLWNEESDSISPYMEYLKKSSIVKKIKSSGELLDNLSFLCDCRKDEYNRRCTRHFTNVISSLLEDLILKSDQPYLDYADTFRRKYIIGFRINDRDRIVLKDKAQEMQLSTETVEKIETMVIHTINKELILFQTLLEEKAAPILQAKPAEVIGKLKKVQATYQQAKKNLIGFISNKIGRKENN